MKRSADHYSRLAKKKNYPARSVFKLEEMQRRFSLLSPGQRILDIGSAPGSWSKYCLEQIGAGGRLVAVDLERAAVQSPGRANYTFLQGDIFTRRVALELEKLAPFDVILSDAAPLTSGNALVDTQHSLQIAERVLEIAGFCLKAGGNLVVKIFQGGDEGQLLQRLKTRFRRARAFKPAASRGESREVYFLGIGSVSPGTSGNPGKLKKKLDLPYDSL